MTCIKLSSRGLSRTRGSTTMGAVASTEQSSRVLDRADSTEKVNEVGNRIVSCQLV